LFAISLVAAAALAVVVQSSRAFDPPPNFSPMWWHSEPNVSRWVGSAGGGMPLYWAPLPCASAPDGSWALLNSTDARLFASYPQGNAHVNGEMTLSASITNNGTVLDQSTPVSLKVNDRIPSPPGYVEYQVQFDLTPVGGGPTFQVTWPVQVWGSPPAIGIGVPHCSA
jgi:hypothetical protein